MTKTETQFLPYRANDSYSHQCIFQGILKKNYEVFINLELNLFTIEISVFSY